MIKTEEYYNELSRRFKEGGIIWLIERTDTNEFYEPSSALKSAHDHPPAKWLKTVSLMCALNGYLTKEDGEKDFKSDIEYGCPKCGHGKTPTQITEHEFVNSL